MAMGVNDVTLACLVLKVFSGRAGGRTVVVNLCAVLSVVDVTHP